MKNVQKPIWVCSTRIQQFTSLHSMSTKINKIRKDLHSPVAWSLYPYCVAYTDCCAFGHEQSIVCLLSPGLKSLELFLCIVFKTKRWKSTVVANEQQREKRILYNQFHLEKNLKFTGGIHTIPFFVYLYCLRSLRTSIFCLFFSFGFRNVFWFLCKWHALYEKNFTRKKCRKILWKLWK